jgi:hypothetical protein
MSKQIWVSNTPTWRLFMRKETSKVEMEDDMKGLN